VVHSKLEVDPISPTDNALVVFIRQERPQEVPENDGTHVGGPEVGKHPGCVRVQTTSHQRLGGVKLHREDRGGGRGGARQPWLGGVGLDRVG